MFKIHCLILSPHPAKPTVGLSSCCPPNPESWPVGHWTTATPEFLLLLQTGNILKTFISTWTLHLRQTTTYSRKPLGLSHWLPVFCPLTGDTASKRSAGPEGGSHQRAGGPSSGPPPPCAGPHRIGSWKDLQTTSDSLAVVLHIRAVGPRTQQESPWQLSFKKLYCSCTMLC